MAHEDEYKWVLSLITLLTSSLTLLSVLTEALLQGPTCFYYCTPYTRNDPSYRTLYLLAVDGKMTLFHPPYIVSQIGYWHSVQTGGRRLQAFQ